MGKTQCNEKKCESKKHRKCSRGKRGHKGHDGQRGPTGPTGPTGSVPTLPFVRTFSSPLVPNNNFEGVTNYSVLFDGGLGTYFNNTTGIFTALTAGLYQFEVHVTFQLPSAEPNNTVSTDGDRLMRLEITNGNEAGTQSFIGQYHFVAPDSLVSSRSAFIFQNFLAFEDSLTTSDTIALNAGGTVRLVVYQNNLTYLQPLGSTGPVVPTGGVSQVAFTEFMVTKLSSLPVTFVNSKSFVPASGRKGITPI